MFILLGISVLLAALLTLNSLASLATATVWRISHRFTRHWSAAASARILCLLRLLPATLGVTCVLFLLTPAYLELEPRATAERVSLKLAIIALASAVGMGLAIIRGVAAWRATARLTADWRAHGERISVPQVAIPAYRIEHQFPVVAIVGILRPRLFLGSQIFDSLTPAEIAAAVEHEAGHLVAHDNLKRGLLRACRDVTLIIPCGRALDRAWAEASESAADEHDSAGSQRPGLGQDLPRRHRHRRISGWQLLHQPEQRTMDTAVVLRRIRSGHVRLRANWRGHGQ